MLRRTLKSESLERLMRIWADLSLATDADPANYGERDLEWMLDASAVFSNLDAGDWSSLTSSDMASVLKTTASKVSITRQIAAVKALDDAEMCLIRDEAQALHEYFSSQLGQLEILISPQDFLRYLMEREATPSAQTVVSNQFRALGLPYPPMSVGRRALAGLKADTVRTSTKRPPTSEPP